MTRPLHILTGAFALGLSLSGSLLENGASAQEVSQLAIQRPDAVNTLNGHLARLAEDPRDINALIGAGEAALELDDPRSATGFFARADAIQSGNGRIKAGLGRAMVEMQNPVEALRLFGEAARLGYPAENFVADRGLAHDLTGDQAAAQRDYAEALRTKRDDPELIRRYAVSLGISGDVEAADKQLKPLLAKQDRGAWRDKAFILAMNGQRTEALEITTRTMPPALASAIRPYMERMSLLNAQQRAAAVHFGIFPSDPAIRTAALPPEKPKVVAAAPAPATPVDPRAARKAQREADKKRKAELALAQQKPRASTATQRSPAQTGQRIPEPPVQVAANARQQPATPQGMTPAQAPAQAPTTTLPFPPGQTRPAASAPAAQQPVSPATTQAVQGPTPDGGVIQRPATAQPAPVQSAPTQSTPAQSVQAQSAPVQATPPQMAQAEPVPPPPPPASAVPTPAAMRTLADIMRELEVPDSERQHSVAAANLDEVARIQADRRAKQKLAAAEKAKKEAAAKAKAEADAKAAAEKAEKARIAKNPSRNWVQVGVGRDLSAMPFTWKALTKKHDTLAAKDAWTAGWGKTNRLVVGPFPSFAKAKDYEAQLKKAGADAFAWQSDAGEEVSRLGGK